MQKQEELKEYSGIRYSDFNDWEDDIFDENVPCSNEENKLKSEHLIKNLSKNTTCIQSDTSPIFREVSCNRNIATLKWKEIRLPKLRTVNTSLQKEKKTTQTIFSRNKTTCIRKHPDEYSDSEDFCAPIKKRKKTEVEPEKAFTRTDVLTTSINYENIPVIEISLEEISKSQSDMSVSANSSQMSVSQKGSQQEIKTVDGHKMTQNSQNSLSQQSTNSTVNLSPKKICSSQESLGNEILNIKIDENSILNATSQSGTHTVIAPNTISTHEVEISKSEAMNQNVNSEMLKVYRQKCLNNDIFPSKSLKADFLKTKFTKKFDSSVSDTSLIKNGKRYNKEQKRVIWNIRKRELEVIKRENAAEIREKLLEAREADLEKRERILKTRGEKYLSLKEKIKNELQNLRIKTKKWKKRSGVLEDGTNSFNTRMNKEFGLLHAK